MAYIRGMDPLICINRIALNDAAKPTIQMQRRLNRAIKMVKSENLKLLDAGIINPLQITSR